MGGDDPIGRFLIGRVKKRSISELKKAGVLLRILSSDGMTVFNKTGRLMEAGFIFDKSLCQGSGHRRRAALYPPVRRPTSAR